MSRSVLDLGLRPTKRAKAQAIRRHRNSEGQTNTHVANQIQSAQQLQSSRPPPPNPHAKPLGLQEIGLIFDQETERMWEINLMQSGLSDGMKTRHQLSQLHHELFRVNQYKILDRYWQRSSRILSEKANAREIARKHFRMTIYKRCKRWFKTENETTYLNGNTDMGSTQLQPRGTSEVQLGTVDSNNNEGLSRAQSQSETMSVRLLNTSHSSNREGTTCAQCWARSRHGRTSESLPARLDPAYYDEHGSVQSQLERTPCSLPSSLDPVYYSEHGPVQSQLGESSRSLPDTFSSDEEVGWVQLQCLREFEITLDPTLAHWDFPTSVQRVTGQEQLHDPYMGHSDISGDLYEQTSLS